MDQQCGQLVPKGAARRCSLSIGCFSGDHHVPEQLRRERCKRPLAHRKREDIRTCCLPSILPVQAGHGPVAHQQQPALGLVNPCSGEGGLPDLF